MTKAKAIVLTAFVVVFAAGMACGVLVGRRARPPRRRSRLAGELGLSPEQREQMRQIWSEVMRSSPRPSFAGRRAIREERDEAVRALLNEEQAEQYDKLMEDYRRKLDELSQERRKRHEEAVERTKAILTEEQRKKYEDILQTRGGPGGRFRGRPFRGGPPVQDTPLMEQPIEE